MLSRHDDCCRCDRDAVFVGDADLALVVRAEPVDDSCLTQLGDFIDDAMRKSDRHRHEFGGLVAGVTEHQPLVPCPFAVNAHRDVATLTVQPDVDRAGIGIESDVVRLVAN